MDIGRIVCMREGMKKNGRPSAYSEKIAAKICERLAGGESLRSICRDGKMPAMSTVMLWAANNREGFSERYDKACEARFWYHADELLDIADDGRNDFMEKLDPEGQCIGYVQNGESVGRSRLRVDTRKWLLSKMIPKFSDKVQLEHSGTTKMVILDD